MSGKSGAREHERQQHRADCRKILLRMLRPGTRVYTRVLSASRSGMTRSVLMLSVYHREIRDISGLVATVLKERLLRDGGVRVGGCGFDAGHHLVNNLSYELHGWNTKGTDALASTGRPFKPTRTQFCAGYSLEHERL